jgi:hypothetical protein
MRRVVACGFFLVGTLLVVGPASAQDRARTIDDFSIPDKPASRVDIESENIFGFTEGTDTNEKDEKELSVESISRFQKRRLFGGVAPQGAPGEGACAPAASDDDPPVCDAAPAATGPGGKPRFRATSTKLGFEYGVTDDFSMEFNLFGQARNVKNMPGLPNKSFASFDGGSIEFKYRLIQRTPENPFGLAVEFEPRVSRVEEETGRAASSFSGEMKLMFDVRLVPDRVWFATNVGFEPEFSRLRGTGERERQSTFGWSNALTFRLDENVLAGAEMRYLRAYDGAFLNRFEADAWYIGPTLYAKLSKSAYLSAAFSARITGSEKLLEVGEFGTAVFERYAFRLKLGAEF